MFCSCKTSGWHMKFENGYTVSVQYGPGNYGSNYNASYGEERPKGWSAYTAEVGVWDADGRWINDFSDTLGRDTSRDDVIPRCTADDVAKIVTAVAAFSRKG